MINLDKIEKASPMSFHNLLFQRREFAQRLEKCLMPEGLGLFSLTRRMMKFSTMLSWRRNNHLLKEWTMVRKCYLCRYFACIAIFYWRPETIWSSFEKITFVWLCLQSSLEGVMWHSTVIWSTVGSKTSIEIYLFCTCHISIQASIHWCVHVLSRCEHSVSWSRNHHTWDQGSTKWKILLWGPSHLCLWHWVWTERRFCGTVHWDRRIYLEAPWVCHSRQVVFALHYGIKEIWLWLFHISLHWGS